MSLTLDGVRWSQDGAYKGDLQAGQWIKVDTETDGLEKLSGIYAVITNTTSLWDGQTCFLVNKEGKLSSYSGNRNSIDGYIWFHKGDRITKVDASIAKKELESESITKIKRTAAGWSENILKKLELE